MPCSESREKVSGMPGIAPGRFDRSDPGAHATGVVGDELDAVPSVPQDQGHDVGAVHCAIDMLQDGSRLSGPESAMHFRPWKCTRSAMSGSSWT